MRAWRRGFREADLILGPFADAHVRDFDEAQMIDFESLLNAADHDIFAWVSGAAAPPSDIDPDLVRRLAAFATRPR